MMPKTKSTKRSSLPRRTVSVPLGERSYQIIIGADLINEAGSLIRSALGPDARCIAIISNRPVFERYGQRLTRSLAAAHFRTITHLIGDGERYKNLKTVEGIYRALAQNRLDRQSAIIALGGGVVGDVAGFAAASFLRGISVVQIPTTLLAATDSAVGGKTGVNLPEGKNLVGAFHQPRLVITDIHLLESLPPRERRAALFEALRYGVLADPELFDRISQAGANEVPPAGDHLIDLIARCCQIKADVVARDEREAGWRQILNLGHTFGHALEAITHYRRFKHGEAVAYGVILASRVARALGLIESGESDKIEAGVRSIGRLPSIADLDADTWFDAMRHDKKARHDQLTFILPTRIGAVEIVHDVPNGLIKRAIRKLLQSQARPARAT
jgi:3-dehydroquinate synthase